MHTITALGGGFVPPAYDRDPLAWLYAAASTIAVILLLAAIVTALTSRDKHHPRSRLLRIALALTALALAAASAAIGAFALPGSIAVVSADGEAERARATALADWAHDRYELTVDPDEVGSLAPGGFLTWLGYSPDGALWEPTGTRILLVDGGDGSSYLMTAAADGTPIAEISKETSRLFGGFRDEGAGPDGLNAWIFDRYGITVDDARADALLIGETATALVGGELVTFRLAQAIDGNSYAVRDDTDAELVRPDRGVLAP